jgi:hypothetical protein
VLGEQIHLNYKIRLEKFVKLLIFITFNNHQKLKINRLIQQITKGIKISVETKFEGSFLKDQILHHAFMYFITIENQGKDVVQLLSRHWKILESVSRPQYVNGNGVVGKKPVIKARRKSYLPIRKPYHLSSRIYDWDLHNDQLFYS